VDAGETSRSLPQSFKQMTNDNLTRTQVLVVGACIAIARDHHHVCSSFSLVALCAPLCCWQPYPLFPSFQPPLLLLLLLLLLLH
jgi:hypothetical protein